MRLSSLERFCFLFEKRITASPVFRIDGQSDAPPRLVATIDVAMASLDQGLQLRAVRVRAHDTHAFAVAPVELAAILVENDLLGREGTSFGHVTVRQSL